MTCCRQYRLYSPPMGSICIIITGGCNVKLLELDTEYTLEILSVWGEKNTRPLAGY